MIKLASLILAGAIPIILYYYYKLAIAKVDIASYHEGFFFGVIVLLFLFSIKRYNEKSK